MSVLTPTSGNLGYPLVADTVLAEKCRCGYHDIMKLDDTLDKSPERIRQMFDAVAPRYDFLNHLLSFGIDRYWRRNTARKLVNAETVDGDILDVCCGTGDISLAFRNRQKERNIYGIDFSPEMIKRAKQKAEHMPNLHFSVSDAQALPFETDRFAVVAVAFGLRNVCDPQQALSEMVRACKPEGIVAVLEFSMPTLPVLKQCYRFYFRSVLPFIGQMFAKNRYGAYQYLPESVSQFDRPAEIAHRLAQLGLTEVQTAPMTFGVASLTCGIKPPAVLS